VCRLPGDELVVAILRSDRRYVAGAISPLGQRRRLGTFVDEDPLRHPSVFVSGGRRGLEIELTPDDLVRLTDACAAPLAA
jgi:Cys-tRNA(Pro)/Cys-tRNA(Cys) deacylase